MRTPSQDFADLLFKSPNKVHDFLKTFSWVDGYPLFWIAISGHAREEWIKEIEKYDIPQTVIQKSLKMLIAQGGDWAPKKLLAEFLVGRLEYTQKDFLFHRAAVAGSYDFFPLLLSKDPDFNWNSLNDDKVTPLYLALDHGHLKTAAAVLKYGGLESFRLEDQKGQKLTVLELMYKKKMGFLKEFKAFWKTVHERHLLGDAVAEIKIKKSKKDRKM